MHATFLRSALLLSSLCALTPACDAPDDRSAAETVAVDGLKFTERDDQVEGTFDCGAATIHFNIERDGEARAAVLAAGDGTPLLESLAEPGHETVTLLGGRAVLSGDPGSPEPTTEGDLAAYDELKAMPEAQCIGTLHAALVAAGVDPVLLGAERPADAITPRAQFDGKYWNLYPNETITVGTWGWLTYTMIGVRVGPTLFGLPVLYACVQYQPGAAAWASRCSNTQESVSAHQFWGVLLNIKNPNYHVVMQVRTY